MESKEELHLKEPDGSSQGNVDVTTQEPRELPGCFKRTIAFLFDEIFIAVLCIVLFFPFSGWIDSLYQHAWIPAFLIGGIYFAVLESSVWRCQSIGKMIFSMKVNTVAGKPISPLVSFGRYVVVVFPFLNQDIEASLISIVGGSYTQIISIIYLILVGVVLSGNTLFMLLHPQKRGLHDIISGAAVFSTKYENNSEIKNFALRPVLGGVGFLVVLGLLSGGLFLSVANNLDFADVEQLNQRIQAAANDKHLSASYRIFSVGSVQKAFIIEVHVPVPYEKVEDKAFTEQVANKLYPLVKKVNTNPKVDTITVIFHSRKFIGAFPITRSQSVPKKLSEIE